MDANGDDLLLNITPQLADAAGSKGPQAQAVRVSVGRTGRWKERVKQKRLLKQKINRALRDASEPDVLPALRTGSGGRDTTGNLSNKPPPKVHYNPVEDNDLSDSGGSQQAQIIKQKHVVSSLFTRNPEIPGELTNGDYMDQPTAAKISSNAVIDESSFEGLQLDIDLARHLASKLGITKPTEIQRRVIPYMIGRTTLDSATKGTVTVCPNHNQRGEGLDRDILIQAETGSGKTLAYLLPILHRLLLASTIQPESKDSAEPNRDLGTLAIVLTPTRELAQQVYEVAESLLRLPFTQYCEKNDEDNGDKPNSRRHYRKRWMVPGIVIGGDKKQSEKARLRKGITILACTPGRLLDHLQSTQSFRVDNLRWLVLDEADRLLELGFEQTLKSILELLDSKGKAGKLRRDRQGVSESAMSVEFPQTSNGRQTILCSATLPDNVRQLANQSLDRPITFNAATTSPTAVGGDPAGKDGDNTDEKGQMYSIPSQLEQTCIITPAKLRLVTLISLLKIILRDAPLAKILVFMSNCDSVDYYQHLIATATELNSEGNDGSGSESSDDDDDDVARVIKRLSGKPKSDKKPKFADKQKPPKSKRDNFKKNKANQEDEEDPIWLPSVMLAAGDGDNTLLEARLYRLHGSLPQKRRTEVYHSFAKSTASSPAILFTTDVAARGLDLPNVSHIIQFDPPTEVTDYVHRVGRTARLGKVGAAYLFLLPSETEYVEMLKSKGVGPSRVTSMESILRKAAAAAAAESLAPAVGNKHKDHKRRRDEGMTDQVWQDVAAELQTTIERYVLTKKATATLAKKAYLSSIRAYSTHITSERHIFHVKKLHLGHMVKSFGLREAPSQLATTNRKFHQQQKRHTDKAALEKSKANKKRKQQRGHSYTNAEEFAVAGDVKSLLKAPKSKKARRE